MRESYEPLAIQESSRPQHLYLSISFFCASLLVLLAVYTSASGSGCSPAKAWDTLNVACESFFATIGACTSILQTWLFDNQRQLPMHSNTQAS